MKGAIELSLWFAGLWVTSVAIAYLGTRLLRRRTPKVPPFMVDASWKLRTQEGVLRVRYLGRTARGYQITAPLSMNSHVALRPGDRVHVEAPGAGVSITFRSYIIGRDLDSHTLIVQETEDFVIRNHRDDPRIRFSEGEPAKLNGQPSVLMDLSQSGAKLRTRAQVSTGDWVRLDLPDQEEQFACVLEVLPDTLDGRPAHGVRLVFAEPK